MNKSRPNFGVHYIPPYGTLYFYSGASNTFDIQTKDQMYKFDIRLKSLRDYNTLKDLLIQINDSYKNVIMVRK